MTKFRLDGKRALITGGSKGIGLGIARGFAEAGADIVLLARNQAELGRARNELAQLGAQVTIVPFDLISTNEIPAMYGKIIAEVGIIDILVNNAGTTHRAPAEELALENWQEVIDLNLTAVFALSQAFANELIARKRPGRILNIASVMSAQTRPGVSAYTASKGGIKQLTQALAVDWARYGILVNAIAPGYIGTPLNKPLIDNPQFNAWVKERCPLGRWGTPADIAYPAVFLASEAARFITGQTIYVDGGWLSRF